MRDVSAVGSGLTPAQQDEVMADLSFFLDEYGSTRAVRAKLQEQERDIKRLDGIVRRLLSGNSPQQQQEKEEGEEKESNATNLEEESEGADETMADLDFFLRRFGSTRAVREKLQTQSQRIVGLQRTMKWLQDRWNAAGESSSDVEYLGTEPPPKADDGESSNIQLPSDNDDADGTDNGDGSENEDTGEEDDVVMVSTQQCENDNQEKSVEVVPAEQKEVMGSGEDEGKASSSCSVADESDSSEVSAKGSSAAFKQQNRVDAVGKPAVLANVCPYLHCENYTQAHHLCAAHGGFLACEVHGCIRKAIAQSRCRAHGGDKCKIDGCNKLSVYRGKGHCIRHAREQGALPKLVCKELGCDAFREGKFHCREHLIARLEKTQQKDARMRAKSVGARSTSSSTRTHGTCRAVGCMKWVKRFGDDNEYCASHQCPSASRDDSPRGSIPGTITSFFSSKRNQQQVSYALDNNRRVTCKQPGCQKLGKCGAKKGFCFEHGGGYTCTQPGCKKERALKGLCIAHGGFHACKTEGCGKRASVTGFCSQHSSQRSDSRPPNKKSVWTSG